MDVGSCDAALEPGGGSPSRFEMSLQGGWGRVCG
jgi:hypothetical protein